MILVSSTRRFTLHICVFQCHHVDKYYVVDVGYPNIPGFLAPYKGIGYHRSDYQNGRQPREGKGKFNYCHSSLRNIIERCFGVWKARWPILKQMSPFPFETQRHYS